MQRFRLILEFCDHSRFPPPLCAITYPYILYKNLTKLRKCLPTLSTNCPKIKGHAQSTTDVEVGRNAEGSKTSQSSTKTSAKVFDMRYLPMLEVNGSPVKGWERSMVTEFYNENKGKQGCWQCKWKKMFDPVTRL